MDILGHIILSILIGLGTSVFAVPVIVRVVRKLKILDHPNIRSSNVHPIPTLGGIAVYIAFLFGTGRAPGKPKQTGQVYILGLGA